MKKRYEVFKVSEYDHMPSLYDTVGKVIRFGYTQETKKDEDDNDVEVYVGYNIPLSGHMDYGHIKSQIVEHVYAPKEEFAILSNAVSALIKERAGVTDDPAIDEDIAAFIEFDEWREMAGDAAQQLINSIM